MTHNQIDLTPTMRGFLCNALPVLRVQGCAEQQAYALKELERIADVLDRLKSTPKPEAVQDWLRETGICF